MSFIIWLALIFLVLYTMGFSLSLWKEKNKLGSLAVFILGGMIIASSFFGILKP